jgi:hypothetical protein
VTCWPTPADDQAASPCPAAGLVSRRRNVRGCGPGTAAQLRKLSHS